MDRAIDHNRSLDLNEQYAPSGVLKIWQTFIQICFSSYYNFTPKYHWIIITLLYVRNRDKAVEYVPTPDWKTILCISLPLKLRTFVENTHVFKALKVPKINCYTLLGHMNRRLKLIFCDHSLSVFCCMFKSSSLKLLVRSKPNFNEMLPRWHSSKIVQIFKFYVEYLLLYHHSDDRFRAILSLLFTKCNKWQQSNNGC